MTKVMEFKINGRTVKAGDFVKVAPSKPGKRDGFEARVRAGEFKGDALVSVEVAGAPGSRATAVRSIRPERITTFNTNKQQNLKDGQK